MLAAQTIHAELTKKVQHDDDDEGVGRVPMQAPHDACRVPLLVGHVLNRCVGLDDAGIEKDVQIDAGCCRYPVEVPAEGAEPGERVVALTECVFEYAFGFAEQAVKGALYESHGIIISRCAIRGR